MKKQNAKLTGSGSIAQDHSVAAGERGVAVGRDVIGGIISTGDHNQFFIGDYERLRDAYIEPWPVFERVDLTHFVGREWLLAEVDAFLHNHRRGYFILEADAGLGKTTFLAWLVKERGYIHHFVELAPGLEGVGRGLKNLASQVVLAYHLDVQAVEGMLPGTAARPDYVLRLLKEAAGHRRENERIVLVVDGLDEAGAPGGQNVLGLPSVLPEGVFFIVSQRPVPVTLQVDAATTPRHLFHLSADHPENRGDMSSFLENATTWPGISRALQTSGHTPEQFVDILMDKCKGVWIYLHYVVREIEQGERLPLNLHDLPDGMFQYYAQYWNRWRDADQVQWYEIYLPTLATLAAAQEAIPIDRLAKWVGAKASTTRLQRLLNEQWRPFLALAGREAHTRYRFYHATLREFFEGKVARGELRSAAEASFVQELAAATRKAHTDLAERYLTAWGGLDHGLPGLREGAKRDLDEGYGLRWLVAHLEGADRVDDLHRLLRLEWTHAEDGAPYSKPMRSWWRHLGWTSRRIRHYNAWHQMHEQAGQVEVYLADVARAWRLAERNVHEGLGLQVRYALITASLNSLARNLPPSLLVALIQNGVWSAAKGLAYARQVPSPLQQSVALAELGPYLPEPLMTDALETARGIQDEFNRVRALAALAPYVPERHRSKALQEARAAIQAIRNVADRAHLLAMPALSAELLDDAVLLEVMTAAQQLSDPIERAWALAGIAPRLPERERVEAFRLALEATRRIAAPYVETRIQIMAGMAPNLPNPLRADLWEVVQSIEDSYYQLEALAAVAPYLQEAVLREALDSAWQIFASGDRVATVVAIAAHLPEPLKQETLRQALGFAQKPWNFIFDAEGRTRALLALIPHIPERKGNQLLRKALTLAPKIGLEYQRAKALGEICTWLARRGAPDEALNVVRRIEDENWRLEALAQVVPHLPASLLGEALAVAWVIGDGDARASARARLACQSPERLLTGALEEVRAMSDARAQAIVLVELAAHLPEPWKPRVLQEAMASAWKLARSDSGGMALEKLVPHLPEPLLHQALEEAQRIRDVYERATVLAKLASRLPEPLLREALVAAQDRENLREDMSEEGQAPRYVYSVAQALPLLLPRLAELGYSQEALMAAHKIGDPQGRALTLARLIPYLAPSAKEEILREALAEAWTFSYGWRQTVFSMLAPHMSETLLREALARSQAIDDRYPREEALASFLPHLARLGHLDEALNEAQKIKQQYERESAVAELVSQMIDLGMLEEALKEVQKIDYDGLRRAALSRVAPHLSKLSLETLHPLWLKMLHSLAGRTRQDLVSDLVALAPVLTLLATQGAVEEAFHAIEGVACWWP
jgi:hypothetical protein